MKKQIARVSVFVFLFLAFVIHHSSLCLSSDWPQFQCNAARTGWTPDSPAPPYELAYIAEIYPEPVGQVQPIIYNDMMYVPTLEGRLYALAPTTGERLWAADGCGPVLRSAAAANGMIYVANVPGEVQARRAEDGQLAWRRELGFGCSATPCLEGGRLYIGARNGDFFCLDGKTGEVVWKTRLDNYVFSSAAAAGGRVYIVTDGEIRLYCLDADTGKVMWRTDQVNGLYMREFCPVVHGGRVFFRTQPAEHLYAEDPEFVPPPYDYWKTDSFMTYYEELREGRLPEDFQKANDRIVGILEKTPTYQSMFAFDAATGKQSYIVAVWHLLGGWSSAAPPPAVDSEGFLQAPVPFGMSRFGRLDPETGKAAWIVVGSLPEPPPRAGAPDAIGTNSDESHGSSCGGDRVFWKHWHFGGCDSSLVFNVKTREVSILPGMPYGGPRTVRVSVSARRPVRPAGGDAKDFQSGGDFTAASIWQDFFFHQHGDCIFAFRGKGGETK